MATLKKYDLTGKEVGKHEIDDSVLHVKSNMQMIKNYLVAIRNNARQWSANTKTRAEVNKTKKKPHAQKGTGRARQGSLAAPHFKGGGVAFGPKPKFDQHVRINRKERRLAIKTLICEKIQEGSLMILKLPTMKEPKTKLVSDFLNKLEINNKSVLFLGESQVSQKAEKTTAEKNKFVLSMRNIPKTDFASISHLNGYDLVKSKTIVVLEPAFDQMVTLISGDQS